MPGQNLDDIDLKIIRLLLKNGRMPNTEIAKKASISEGTVRKRLQQLIDEGYIRILAMGNHEKMAEGVMGNIRIKADIKKTEMIATELKKIVPFRFIIRTSGGWDFEAEYIVRNANEAYNILEQTNKIDGVIETELTSYLKYLKADYGWWVDIY
jgi:Lrp/AsnC family transcriptional regulator, regulator for asnA, asnC and gidA